MRSRQGRFRAQRRFEHGQNVLRGASARRHRACRRSAQALEARAGRVRPGLDDKRLTAWNALMIAALADAGAVLERDDYLEAATTCASFVLGSAATPTAGCCARWKERPRARLPRGPRLPARGAAHAVRGDVRPGYLPGGGRARRHDDRALRRTPSGAASSPPPTTTSGSIARRKDLEDSPIPSGSSSAAFGLLRLALLSGEGPYEREPLGVLRLRCPMAGRHPTAFGHLLQAIDFYLAPRARGRDRRRRRCRRRWSRVVRGEFRPHLVLAGGARTRSVPLLEGRAAGRRPRGRLRVRALRLPGAGDHAEELAAALAG